MTAVWVVLAIIVNTSIVDGYADLPADLGRRDGGRAEAVPVKSQKHKRRNGTATQQHLTVSSFIYRLLPNLGRSDVVALPALKGGGTDRNVLVCIASRTAGGFHPRRCRAYRLHTRHHDKPENPQEAAPRDADAPSPTASRSSRRRSLRPSAAARCTDQSDSRRCSTSRFPRQLLSIIIHVR
jgi:hypothetical protein